MSVCTAGEEQDKGLWIFSVAVRLTLVKSILSKNDATASYSELRGTRASGLLKMAQNDCGRDPARD